MAHPTCAPAHLPNNPPDRTDSPGEFKPDPFELTMQVIREIKGTRAAYRVVACIQSITDASEAHALMLIADAEFKHRVELAMKTLRAMRPPARTQRQPAPPAL